MSDIQSDNQTKTFEWVHDWSRSYGVQYCQVLNDEMERCPFAAVPRETHLFYPNNNNAGHFIRADVYKKHSVPVDPFFADEDGLIKKLEAGDKCGKEYVATAKRISEMPLEKLDNLELLNLYEEYLHIWIQYSAYVWLFFHTNELFSPKIEKFLQEKQTQFASSSDAEEFLEYVVSPIKKSSTLKLNDELLQIKKNHNEEKLKILCEQYKWIPCLDLHHPPWSVEDLKKYYENHEFVDKPPPDESILAKIILNGEEKKLVRVSRIMTYMKDLRDEYRRTGVYYVQFLYKEIAKRIGVNQYLLSYASTEEICNFLKTNEFPNKDKLAERKEGFLLFKTNNHFFCYSGNEMLTYAKEIGFKKPEVKNPEIRGTIGSKGKICGTVKVVLTEADLHKILPGDILVALTTNPAYTPVMSKAAAFVTDEGGMTAHAAIVAREMKKPCIVGTKTATKLLKDGDYVEVDANQGIVRILRCNKKCSATNNQ